MIYLLYSILPFYPPMGETKTKPLLTTMQNWHLYRLKRFVGKGHTQKTDKNKLRIVFKLNKCANQKWTKPLLWSQPNHPPNQPQKYMYIFLLAHQSNSHIDHAPFKTLIDVPLVKRSNSTVLLYIFSCHAAGHGDTRMHSKCICGKVSGNVLRN